MAELLSFISLECLAGRLGLPRRYLRDLADQGEIPHLVVGGRRRFREGAVREALDRLAERAAGGHSDAA